MVVLKCGKSEDLKILFVFPILFQSGMEVDASKALVSTILNS